MTLLQETQAKLPICKGININLRPHLNRGFEERLARENEK